MKKFFSMVFLFVCAMSLEKAYCATTASQTINATLTRVTPPGPGPGPGPVIPGGAVVGIVGGGVAAGSSALAFAPLLLAGLTPDGVISAAAPIDCVPCQQDLLQKAIMHFFCTTDYCSALEKMKCNGKFYIVQNNETIRNGSFDVQKIILPIDFKNAKKIKINVTIASENYKEVNGEPELALGIYKDISTCDLNKKFETQQFLHGYLMKKYTIPLKITDKTYSCGIQKLTGEINLKDIKLTEYPFHTVVTFTENGFHRNQLQQNPKVKMYAYVIEFEKIS